MSEANYWSGLTFDEARRVDKRGRHDFFWAVVENDSVALALVLPEGGGVADVVEILRRCNLRVT